MSIALQATPALNVLPNNNPGNTPDYTEHEYITLRRYSGRPVNHTEADDNLELLRKKIGDIINFVNVLNENVFNINEEVQVFNINEEFINNVINRILIDDSFWQDVNVNLRQYLIDDSTFNEFVDGRVIKFFEGDISQYIDNRITEVITGLPEGFIEALVEYLDTKYVDWDTFNNIEVTVNNINNNINQSIKTILAPYLVDLSAYETRLTAIENFLEQLLDFTNNGDPIDLTEVINAINSLAVDIGINANNIAILDANLTTVTTSLALVTDTVAGLSASLTALTNVVDGIVAYIDGALKDLLDQVKGMFDDLAMLLGALVAQIVQNGLNIQMALEAIQQLNLSMALRFAQVWREFASVWSAIEDLEKAMCKVEAENKATIDFLNGVTCEEVKVCEDGEIKSKWMLTVSNGVDDFDIGNAGNHVDGEIVMLNGEAYQVNDEAQANANPLPPATAGVANPGWTAIDTPPPGCWAAHANAIAANIQNCVAALANPGAQNAVQQRQDVERVFNERAKKVKEALAARAKATQQGLDARLNKIKAGAGQL